jgi:predicted nucleic acid-binding Zn ribbon protein
VSEDEAKQPDASEAPTEIHPPAGPQSPAPTPPKSGIALPPPPPVPGADGATATAVAAPPPQEAGPDEPITCPNCGAVAEPGQLVCLECGERLALDYKRPPSWRLPAIVVGVVLLLAGAGLAIALSRIGDDANKVAQAPEPTQQLQTQTPTSPAPTVTTKTNPTPTTNTTSTAKIKTPKISTTPTPSPTPTPTPTFTPTPTPTPTNTGTTNTGTNTGTTNTGTTEQPDVASWPAGKTAYTVVLLSLEDQDAANRAAKRAKAKGLDGVGVLNSDDYSTLNPGFFVVFHRQFRFRDDADKQATRDAREGYDQAYSRRVRPNK